MIEADTTNVIVIASILTYFVILGGCALWGFQMERASKGDCSDTISAHYLGGRNFGPWLTAGTIFASFFSGYTVVGIVNEGYMTGWQSLRWMPSSAGIVGCYVLTGIRLRKASTVRNHQSPTDFITDRYRSQVLRYTVATLQIVTSVIYVSAQVVALKSTFNATFDINPDSPVAVIIMFLIILAFEWAGGLYAVSLSDCVQAFVMVLSFLMMASVVKKHYGGWAGLDPETYPKPQFYQTPSTDSQWWFWQFSLLNTSFFTLPHLMQRVYAARNLRSLRLGWTVMALGPWLTMFVSSLIGTVGVAILEGKQTDSPFADIMGAIMKLGGFPQAAGAIALTASLAAIMSSTDSLIIAISQIVTQEIIYPLRPHASPAQISWAGRYVSLGTVVSALFIGIFWDDGVTNMGNIQFPLTLMVVPPFIYGLFVPERLNAHPWCIAAGAICSSLYVVCIYFLYIDAHSNPVAIDAGVTGFCIQIAVITLLESIRRTIDRWNKERWDDGTTVEMKEKQNRDVFFGNRPEWDRPRVARFGDGPLTAQLLNKMMNGVEEPARNLAFIVLFLFSITLVTPIVPALEPPIEDDGEFAYLPTVLNGLPWWVFKLILLTIVPYIMVFLIIWNVPNDFAVNQTKLIRYGIDPDIVELTPRELGYRIAFDSRNAYAVRRRKQIKKALVQMGIQDSSAVQATTKLTAPEEELMTLVLGKGENKEAIEDEAAPATRAHAPAVPARATAKRTGEKARKARMSAQREETTQEPAEGDDTDSFSM